MNVNYIYEKEKNCFTWELVSKEEKIFASIKVFQNEKLLEVLDLKFFDEIQKDKAKRIFINLLKEHARHSLIKEIIISENVNLEKIEINKQNVNPEYIKIIPETDNYKHQSEAVCKKSFNNKFVPGCNEHLFLHELRKTDLYLPEFSRIAILDDKVVGGIWYTKSYVVRNSDNVKIPLVTFGPLCVDPEYQGCRIGEKLLLETLPLVKKAGYPGIIIFGEPTYYPRFNFKTCNNFNITTSEGSNFDAFMGLEFEENSLFEIAKDGGAKYFEIDIENILTPERLSEFDKQFEKVISFKRPGQWN